MKDVSQTQQCVDAVARKPRSICLVGNAPTVIDRSQMINRADVVVRFNNAFGFGSVNGTRTSHLFLINCGGQMREWLDDPHFAKRRHVETAGDILLPMDPDKDALIEPPLTMRERSHPDARNYACEARSMLEKGGKTVTIVPAQTFVAACRIIGYERPERAMDAPSTGLIALLWTLERFTDPVDVIGFGFDGWSGHRWDRERTFFATMETEGRLRIHPVG